MPNTYEIRAAGKAYCETEGSSHYKGGDVEPMDLIMAKGLGEGFCIGNMIKYAARFVKTRNLEDLKKVVDYAHFLVGIELSNRASGAKP